MESPAGERMFVDCSNQHGSSWLLLGCHVGFCSSCSMIKIDLMKKILVLALFLLNPNLTQRFINTSFLVLPELFDEDREQASVEVWETLACSGEGSVLIFSNKTQRSYSISINLDLFPFLGMSSRH